VVWLMLWQGLKPATIGVAVGVAAALAAGHVMSALLFGVAPQDPLTFVGVIGLLLGVVLTACLIPAWRATSVAPVMALRGE
jgi:ABC-type antimicrobial peptide transport system permease subunit